VLAVTPATRSPGEPAPGDARAGVAAVSSEAEPVSEASVDSRATLLMGASASYTSEAEAAGVEANVPLELVVDALGIVVGARALAHVGYGLEEAALRSVRAFRFSPARRAGKALAVRMRWVMRFQLR
jgi:protein TonB